jgi:3-oxoacyl-[acyl-carrier protein] reductase
MHGLTARPPPAGAAVPIAAASLPVRRFGTVQDIAHAAAFFTAPDSGYVTGQVLYVSGGPHG